MAKFFDFETRLSKRLKRLRGHGRQRGWNCELRVDRIREDLVKSGNPEILKTGQIWNIEADSGNTESEKRQESITG